MSTSSGGFFETLMQFLSRLLGGRSAPPAPALPPDNPDEPAEIVTRRVLVVVFDPMMDPASKVKLARQQNWYDVEKLANGFMTEIVNTSGGMARYQIAQRVDVDEFPPLTDGFRYTPETYLKVLRGLEPPHSPATIDYAQLLSRFNVLARVGRNEIDEMWVFAFPHAGLYESAMGGAGAFWCNAPPLKNTGSCWRRFVVMGFSYERGVGEMLEAFGHRAESILQKTFEPTAGDANLWERFTRYDLKAPDRAEVGTIHFAPNSERDYDWANPRQVLSYCDAWYRFPASEILPREARKVGPAEWGGGDLLSHHHWWLSHLPRAAGRKNGIHNNWWQYVMDPGRV